MWMYVIQFGPCLNTVTVNSEDFGVVLLPRARCGPHFADFEVCSFSLPKAEMKTKDDKMLISERYFDSCRRDLSRSPS